jgi:hypothetical protein
MANSQRPIANSQSPIMRWMYSLKQKMTAAIVLTLVIALTLLSNFLDQRNYQKLEESFTSIYKDRLMAESYLFNLYDNLKKKEDVFQTSGYENVDSRFEASLEPMNREMNDIIQKYEETYLTLEEEIKFFKLKKLHESLQDLEQEFVVAGSDVGHELHDKHSRMTHQAFTTLSELSNIQTTEGEIIMANSEKLILSGKSNSRFEISVLVIVALIIIALLATSRSMKINGKGGNAEMN